MLNWLQLSANIIFRKSHFRKRRVLTHFVTMAFRILIFVCSKKCVKSALPTSAPLFCIGQVTAVLDDTAGIHGKGLPKQYKPYKPANHTSRHLIGRGARATALWLFCYFACLLRICLYSDNDNNFI